jgi:hypothetical protein
LAVSLSGAPLTHVPDFRLERDVEGPRMFPPPSRIKEFPPNSAPRSPVPVASALTRIGHAALKHRVSWRWPLGERAAIRKTKQQLDDSNFLALA